MDATNTTTNTEIDDSATEGTFSAEQQALIDAANAERNERSGVTQEAKQGSDSGIPEKFRNEDGSVNTEALLKSYTELEKKLGTGKSEDAAAEGDPAPEGDKAAEEDGEKEAEVKTDAEGKRTFNGVEITDEVQAKANDIYAEMAKNGGALSDDGFQFFKDTFNLPEGVNKEMVKDWIDAKVEAATFRAEKQQAATQAQVDEALATIGGRENFQKMSDWAVENMDPKQVEDLNASLASGSPREVRLALKALAAEYGTKAIIPPSTTLTSEDADSGSDRGDIFQNENEIAEAMNKLGPDGKNLYRTDDKYRRSVEAKVERSTPTLVARPRRR